MARDIVLHTTVANKKMSHKAGDTYHYFTSRDEGKMITGLVKIHPDDDSKSYEYLVIKHVEEESGTIHVVLKGDDVTEISFENDDESDFWKLFL